MRLTWMRGTAIALPLGAIATTPWEPTHLTSPLSSSRTGEEPKAKRDFVSWQKENNWPSTGFSQVGGGANNARAVYFNANDLGAGRRMGMNIFTDIDGKPSVAYYVATFATLADAEEDEAANRQPGDPKSKLKYIVCMDYSLSLKTKFAKGDRLITHGSKKSWLPTCVPLAEFLAAVCLMLYSTS